MPTVYTSEPEEYHIERSRFIGQAFRLTEIDALDTLLRDMKVRYPNANHYTWAYRIDSASNRASDDGEPQGTAGLPLLNILHQQGWGETAVIVVRYFGGVKLGRGGLVRAYQKCATLAMGHATPAERILATRITVDLPYHQFEPARRVVDAMAFNADVSYADSVTLSFTVPQDTQKTLLRALDDLSSGQIEVLSQTNQPVIRPL